MRAITTAIAAPLATVLVCATSTAPAAAQRPAAGPLLGVGYVANAPQMLLGGTLWGLTPWLPGWGLYVDGKVGVSDPADEEGYLDDRSPEDVPPHHSALDREDHWRGLSVAVVRQLTRELSLYVGGGYSEKTAYREYQDPSGTLGRLGFYWVRDDANSGGGANVLGGVILRLSSRVRLHFGGEARPRGFTIGASMVFPGQ